MLTKTSTCILFVHGRNSHYSLFFSKLLELDLPVSRCSSSLLLVSWLAQNNFHKYEHLVEVPETYHAILSKDSARLQCLLRSGKAMDDNEEDIYDLYTLAATASWVEGCQILFNNEVRLLPSHKFGDGYLFSIIIGYGNIDLLKYWLRIRPSLDEAAIERLGSLELALECVAKKKDFDSKKLDIVVAELSKQRRDLETLAMKHLSIKKYSPKANTLLDSQAYLVYKMLVDKGIDVPMVLRPYKTSLYCPESCLYETDVLDTLYQAGLRDMAYPDGVGQPLAFVPPILVSLASYSCRGRSWATVVSNLNWYLVRCSNIHLSWPGSTSKAIHMVGWKLGYWLYCISENGAKEDRLRPRDLEIIKWMSNRIEASQGELRRTRDKGISRASMKTLSLQQNSNETPDARVWRCFTSSLSDCTPDLCVCHCSASGCIPITLMCRSSMPHKRFWRYRRNSIGGQPREDLCMCIC